MRKTITAIYFALLGVGCVLMLCCIFTADTTVTDRLQKHGESELAPYEVKQVNDDVREFYLHVDEVTDTGTCLSFYTNHANVYVYENDALVYSVEATKSIFGTTPGARWNYVELEYGTTDIMVRVEAAYPQVRDYEISFVVGNSYNMALNSIRGSVWEIVVSVLDLFVGAVLIVYGVMTRRRKLNAGEGVLGLGVFSLMMGIWSFLEAEITSILVTNRVAASFCGYTLLMLMIVPFILFLQEYLEVKGKLFARVICVASLINYVVCTVLHLTGIRAYKETVGGTHILMFSALIFLIYALICRFKNVGFDERVRTNFYGVLILLISYVVDMMAYYMGARRTDVVGKLGVLLYICVLGKAVAADAMVSIEEGRKAEIYKELAVRDMLTELYNRNAYDRWVEANPAKPGTAVVTFDLNDLKQCNDTMGHAAGDRYLQHAAMLIMTAFKPEGTCYRIGGDEFCAILEKATEEEIRSKINELEQLEYEYNRNFAVAELHIAHGYAMFDAKVDANIEHTRERADERMYANKRILKAKDWM